MRQIMIDDLGPIIFTQNPENKPVFVKLSEQFENQKDLFYLLVDLFFKGVYYVNVEDIWGSKKIIINSVPLEKFFIVIQKLKNANIKANLKIIDGKVTNDNVKTIINDSLKEVKCKDKNLKLSNYEIHIPINYSIYSLSFEMIPFKF